jgi:hypothetical protein
LSYLNVAKNFSEAQHFIFWFNNFKNKTFNYLLNLSFTLLKSQNLNFLASKSLVLNRFVKFKSEKQLEKFFVLLNKDLSFASKYHGVKSPKSNLLKRFCVEELNENKSSLALPKLNLGKASELLFSFNLSVNPIKIKNNFLGSYTNSQKVIMVRKLRTKNYFAVFSRGRAYALVKHFSFFNINVFKGRFKKLLFKSWLKFLFYFEKFNYLIILNNEEVSFELKNSKEFFNSIYFPLIFNFRNLFFSFVRFFHVLKIYQERFFYTNSRFMKYRKKKFNSKFFGILLRFLLLYNNKNLNKIPKNLLLNFFRINAFEHSNLIFNSNYNSFGLLKTIIQGLFKVFIEKIEYLYLGFSSEKLTNKSLAKLLFVNFSLGYNSSEYFTNQVTLIQNFSSSKLYSLYK